MSNFPVSDPPPTLTLQFEHLSLGSVDAPKIPLLNKGEEPYHSSRTSISVLLSQSEKIASESTSIEHDWVIRSDIPEVEWLTNGKGNRYKVTGKLRVGNNDNLRIFSFDPTWKVKG